MKDYYKPMFLETKPKDKSEDEWKIAHLQACGFIRQWVDDILNHICDVEDARSLWKKLEELYARKEGVNKMLLIKKLMHLRYKEGSTIADHINDFQGIINQLNRVSINFKDEV